MTAYEMMLSESQERMLAILKPGREADGRRIFEKWGLDAAVDRPDHRHRPHRPAPPRRGGLRPAAGAADRGRAQL